MSPNIKKYFTPCLLTMLTITTITFLALYIVEKTSSQKVSDPTCQQLKDNWHIYSTYESYDNVELPVEVLLLNKSGKADPYYLYNDLDSYLYS